MLGLAVLGGGERTWDASEFMSFRLDKVETGKLFSGRYYSLSDFRLAVVRTIVWVLVD